MFFFFLSLSTCTIFTNYSGRFIFQVRFFKRSHRWINREDGIKFWWCHNFHLSLVSVSFLSYKNVNNVKTNQLLRKNESIYCIMNPIVANPFAIQSLSVTFSLRLPRAMRLRQQIQNNDQHVGHDSQKWFCYYFHNLRNLAESLLAQSILVKNVMTLPWY